MEIEPEPAAEADAGVDFGFGPDVAGIELEQAIRDPELLLEPALATWSTGRSE